MWMDSCRKFVKLLNDMELLKALPYFVSSSRHSLHLSVDNFL